MKLVVLYGLFAGLALILIGWPREVAAGEFSGIARYIVDGDTLYLNGVDPAIRVWGLDAPERDQEGFQAARDALTRMAEGKRLRCVEIDRDRHGRIVARCYLKDGRDIAAMMIATGTAKEFCRYSKGYYDGCD